MSYRHGLQTGRFVKENETPINIADFLDRGTNPFGEQKVSFRYPQLTLNSGIPISERRDYTGNSQNGGGVELTAGEYRVYATTAINSIGSLISRQRANYLAGGVLEGGIGLRVPTQPSGDGYVHWGFIDYDGNDALRFRYDSTGYRIQLVSGGTTHVNIAQSDWNIDKLDGNGASGFTLDISKGNVTQIPFVYYGYGDIIFQIMVVTGGRQRLIDIHRIKRDSAISIQNPNLPIAIEVHSGTSGVAVEACVGGRQINSSLPDNIPPRYTSGRREGQTVGTSFVPLVSFKHKSGFNDIFCVISGVEIITNEDLAVEVWRNGTLTDANFEYLGNYVESERALQYDVAATAISDGECVYDTLAVGGAGNRTRVRAADIPNKYISEFDTFSIVAKSLGASATVHTIARNTEKW